MNYADDEIVNYTKCDLYKSYDIQNIFVLYSHPETIYFLSKFISKRVGFAVMRDIVLSVNDYILAYPIALKRI